MGKSGGTGNATGDPITTDGRMVVIEINDCREPRMSTETVDSTLPACNPLSPSKVTGAISTALRGDPARLAYEPTVDVSRM